MSEIRVNGVSLSHEEHGAWEPILFVRRDVSAACPRGVTAGDRLLEPLGCKEPA